MESMSDIENKGGSCSLKLCLDYRHRELPSYAREPRGTNARAGAAVRSESRITAKKDMEM